MYIRKKVNLGKHLLNCPRDFNTEESTLEIPLSTVGGFTPGKKNTFHYKQEQIKLPCIYFNPTGNQEVVMLY